MLQVTFYRRQLAIVIIIIITIVIIIIIIIISKVFSVGQPQGAAYIKDIKVQRFIKEKKKKRTFLNSWKIAEKTFNHRELYRNCFFKLKKPFSE